MKLKVAILGISGSFHEIAAEKYYGESIEIIECKTFKELCEALKHDLAEAGVMAIENSLTGSILQNYTLLNAYNFKIVGETYVGIKMNLMVYPGVKISDLRQIQSHPIAIQQCRDFIETMATGVKIVECFDTAGAAKEIAEKRYKDIAAIAGDRVAEKYGLEILKEHIEDHKKNFTRFVVLSKEGVFTESNNKASISFELCHKAGALADVLQVFKKDNINISKIQSLPIIGKPNEYAFHLDIDWGDYKSYERAINNLLKQVSFLNILGEYKKDEPTGLLAKEEKQILHTFATGGGTRSIKAAGGGKESAESRKTLIRSLIHNWNIF